MNNIQEAPAAAKQVSLAIQQLQVVHYIFAILFQ